MTKIFKFGTSAHTVSRVRLAEELEAASSKFHIIGSWVGVIFDPIFGITDYLNIPHAWQNVFVIRCSIAIIIATAIFFKKKYNYSAAYLGILTMTLISLQNAYTYSLIDIEHFLGHSLNYMALFIGAGMFALWQWYYTTSIMAVSAAATIYFFTVNPQLPIQQALIQGGLLLSTVAVLTILLIQTRYSLTVKTLAAKLALEEANTALNEKNEIIESKNKNILDSIRYAQRIQNAMLPTPEEIKAHFPDNFILFKPKDIVSGDFYWFGEVHGKAIIAAVDCTGHGVPGAFMSMIGCEILNEIVNVWEITASHEILAQMHVGIKKALKQDETNNKDGMDLALCVVDKEAKQLQFSGAMNPLIYIQNQTLIEIKGDKMGVGGADIRERIFTPHVIDISNPTIFYLSSDGYEDQFGGENNTKFKRKNLKALLLSIHQQSMDAQQYILETTIEQWRGTQKQIDDILVIGVSLSVNSYQ
jgi:serine phosphatase RsbU (regulator of sigma subunit)